MFESDELVIWNLTPGQVARCGAVDIFNVVGRVRHSEEIADFSYSLNDGPETPICFQCRDEKDRLCAPGDFNIDTIQLSALQQQNRLLFRIARRDRRTVVKELSFFTRPFETTLPEFTLDLNDASTAEELGQIVDGRWRVTRDDTGRKCLEIAPEDAGYDRIILFGRHDWTTGYEIVARISVTALTGIHNVGLIFKWNPHEQGDGTWMPMQWSTGLAYYCSYGPTPGLRIRLGVDVHLNDVGQKEGDFLLGHAHLSRGRFLMGKVKNKLRLGNETTELTLHRDYLLRLKVHPRKYAFTMWNAGPSRRLSSTSSTAHEPAAQVVADKPLDRLPQGSVGIIAFQAGIRVYQFKVKPIE
jgi:hypothetical protein